jgi:glycyl-tRNA synthetase beta chain
MNSNLLIEIGVEELPAIPFLKELKNIKNRWMDILKEYELVSDFTFFYTPRRLILSCENFPSKQSDKEIELFGAPIDIAFDKDGNPTQAAIGFAKKCGADVGSLQRVKKGDREVLYYKRVKKGRESKELLKEMIEKFLKSLDFGKSMRWGERQESFIRPVRFLGVMFDGSVVEMEIFGVKSSNFTYPHRSISHDKLRYGSIKEYFELLEKNGVIYDQDRRRELIEGEFDQIESQGYEIDRDEELLSEVVAITEYPKLLIGEFEERFLTLPPEVVTTSMKEHQRYFPIYKDGKLTNRFIVISNAITQTYDDIIKGNEKVLRARLSDALFFYENDIKRGLSNEGLEKITFIKGGGTLFDKVQRERKIAKYLSGKYNLDPKVCDRAVKLSKADLLSEMVYEFTELQGIMGYYYAKEAGESFDVALSIKEQYLPNSETSPLPSTDISAVTALSYKLDLILKLFSLNMIPSGSKDPFALRRAAIGVIKIVLDRELEFDIREDIKALSDEYEGIDIDSVEEFFIDRFMQFFDYNPSLIKAVLFSGERDILKISKKLEALDKEIKRGDIKSLSSTFKRVANIVKDVDKKIDVDEALLQEEAEIALHKAFTNLRYDNSDYEKRLRELFSLKDSIDRFFDTVMVNVEDEKIKLNRKALINNIYLSFKEIADIKEITI